jgi:hypothetical protein
VLEPNPWQTKEQFVDELCLCGEEPAAVLLGYIATVPSGAFMYVGWGFERSK